MLRALNCHIRFGAIEIHHPSDDLMTLTDWLVHARDISVVPAIVMSAELFSLKKSFSENFIGQETAD